MSKLTYIHISFIRWTTVVMCTVAPLLLPAQNRQPWEEFLEQYALTEDIDNNDISLRYDELA